MKKTIKDQLLDYLMENHRRLVPKYELEALNKKFKCLSESIDRRARELAEKHSRVDVFYIKGISHYQYVKR